MRIHMRTTPVPGRVHNGRVRFARAAGRLRVVAPLRPWVGDGAQSASPTRKSNTAIGCVRPFASYLSDLARNGFKLHPPRTQCDPGQKLDTRRTKIRPCKLSRFGLPVYIRVGSEESLVSTARLVKHTQLFVVVPFVPGLRLGPGSHCCDVISVNVM